MHTHYTQFVQYTPTDAQQATLYWKSKEGADWRVAKEILAQVLRPSCTAMKLARLNR